MPMYLFRCANEHDFERLIPMAAVPPDCPVCGVSSRKIPTTFGIGSGRSTRPKPAGREFSSSALWREAFRDKPEKLRREMEFRQQLVAKGTRESPSPDRNMPNGVLLD
jgi:putative FmdB family regulatory protein